MKTEVTNVSGATRFFGWIPPHGQRLTDGQQVVLHGDLRSVLAGGRNRYTRRIELSSMDTDVAAGRALVCTTEENCWQSSSSFGGTPES